MQARRIPPPPPPCGLYFALDLTGGCVGGRRLRLRRLRRGRRCCSRLKKTELEREGRREKELSKRKPTRPAANSQKRKLRERRIRKPVLVSGKIGYLFFARIKQMDGKITNYSYVLRTTRYVLIKRRHTKCIKVHCLTKQILNTIVKHRRY